MAPDAEETFKLWTKFIYRKDYKAIIDPTLKVINNEDHDLMKLAVVTALALRGHDQQVLLMLLGTALHPEFQLQMPALLQQMTWPSHRKTR